MKLGSAFHRCAFALLLAASFGCDSGVPYHQPSANRSDAGEDPETSDDRPRRTSGGGSSGTSPQTEVDAGRSNPGTAGTDSRPEGRCGPLDPGNVHLLGVTFMVEPGEPGSVAGIVPDLEGDIGVGDLCWPRDGVRKASPRIHPTAQQLYFVDASGPTIEGEPNPSRVIKKLVLGPDSAEHVTIETTACANVGVGSFQFDRDDGGVIHSCESDPPCTSTPAGSAAVSACADGPWFDVDGTQVSESKIIAVNEQGRHLLQRSHGLAGLAIAERGGEQAIAASPPDVQSPDADGIVLASRGHGDGFRVVVQPMTGANDRSLYLIHADGAVELEGRYADSPAWGHNWAIDSLGRLYDDLGNSVLRSEVGGPQVKVYEAPSNRSLPEARNWLYGGRSAFLATGPW
jgi:hypothetical protein